MKNVKAYKVTHARIGFQEKWAGWQIAGKSEGIPQNSLNAFSKSQSLKGAVGTALTKSISVFEISEFEGNFIISKITFGLVDKLGRLCFRSDGIVFPLTENPELYFDPNNFLSVDKSNFNLILKELYNENSAQKFELKPEIQQGENVITIYSEPVLFDKAYDLRKILNKYFNNDQKRILDFVRCIYWSVSSSTPLYIKSSFNNDEIFEIIYLAYYVLPYSLRAKLSFRTYNIPKLEPTNIIFTDAPISNGKIYDFDNGKNNVFDNVMEKAYQKYQYINFVANNIEEPELIEYFKSLQDTMEELGGADSSNFSFISVAHEIFCEEQGEQGELSNDNILMKFQNFLSLPYNNVKIDWHIAKLLDIIIDKKVTLNESIQERLQAKLKITQSEQLKNIGYSYNAILMIKSQNRRKEFVYLNSLRENENLFNLMCKKISDEIGGDSFLDEFYGDYYGELIVTNYETLDDFINETKQLRIKQKVNVFVFKKCAEFGKKIVDDYFILHIEIASAFTEYRRYIYEKMPQKVEFVNKMLNETKLYFWEKFNLEDFKYTEKDNYCAVEFRTSDKYVIVKELIDVFNSIKSQNISTVNSFIKILDKNNAVLTNTAKQNIIKEFQDRCLSVNNKEIKIDFWYRIATLSKNRCVRFILKNNITVFIDPDILLSELFDSELLSRKDELTKFLLALDKYSQLNGENEKVDKISKILRQFDKDRRKREKADIKNEKKTDTDFLYKKKNKSDLKSRVSDSPNDKSKHCSDRELNSFDDDYIINSSEEKNKKEKKGLLGSIFGKKK